MLKLVALIRAFRALAYWHLILFAWKLPRIKRRHQRCGTYGTPEYLQDFTAAQTDCASRLFWALCKALRIEVEIDDAGLDREALFGPLIAVSNHISTLDILVTYAVLGRLGLTETFWLLKAALEGTPYGRACKETHGALLGRAGTPGDVDRVHHTGQAAQRYGAVAVAYPEGTRGTEEKLGRGTSGFTEVLPPLFGGYTALREEMAEAHTLAIAMRWEGGTRGFNARTLGQIAGLFGRRLIIRVRLYPRTPELDSKEQLLVIWRDMDAWLKGCAEEEARLAPRAAT